MKTKKTVSCAKGVEIARILWELNTDTAQVVRLGREAELLDDTTPPETIEIFCLQWYGFVHAAIVAGLMQHAPNAVMVAYVSTTQALLLHKGCTQDACHRFIDTVFSPYMQLLAEEKQQQCPAHFFAALHYGDTFAEAPRRAVVCISGAMAMLISAVWDALEGYNMLPD